MTCGNALRHFPDKLVNNFYFTFPPEILCPTLSCTTAINIFQKVNFMPVTSEINLQQKICTYIHTVSERKSHN